MLRVRLKSRIRKSLRYIPKHRLTLRPSRQCLVTNLRPNGSSRCLMYSSAASSCGGIQDPSGNLPAPDGVAAVSPQQTRAHSPESAKQPAGTYKRTLTVSLIHSFSTACGSSARRTLASVPDIGCPTLWKCITSSAVQFPHSLHANPTCPCWQAKNRKAKISVNDSRRHTLIAVLR